VSVPVLTRYVAFLRAINVGGHVVKMTELRKLFESIGFDGVETFIASGNVIFESAAKPDRVLEQKIEAELKKRLGYAVDTYVRSLPELQAIAEYHPFSSTEFDIDHAALYVGFLAEAPSREAARRLTALRTPDEGFHVHGREFYWICGTSFSNSAFTGKTLDNTLGVSTTLRNINTVRRLVAKYGQGAKMRG
jgi:uncharacterized protein (DUF1697 family)